MFSAKGLAAELPLLLVLIYNNIYSVQLFWAECLGLQGDQVLVKYWFLSLMCKYSFCKMAKASRLRLISLMFIIWRRVWEWNNAMQ